MRTLPEFDYRKVIVTRNSLMEFEKLVEQVPVTLEARDLFFLKVMFE